MNINNLILTENPVKSSRLWRLSTCLLMVLTISFQLQAQNISADSTHIDSTATPLEQYLKLAAQNNPDLKSAFNQYLASLEEVPQVGSLPDPELAFRYFISPIETRVGPQQARFSVSQMLPWFGTLSAREEVKNYLAKAQFQEFQNKRNQLFYEIKTVWYELYVLMKKISILEENISLLETLEELALQNYESAEGNQSDVLQVQIELEDLRINHSKLLDDKTVLRQKLEELVNSDTVDIPAVMSVSTHKLPAEPTELKEQMQNQNPALNQLFLQEQATQESIRAAKLDGLPKFGIGVDYIFTGQRDEQMIDNGQNAFLARASVQIPLWRKKYRAQKQQAELNQNIIQERQSSQENKLITRFESAMRDFRDAQRKLNLYEEKQIDRTHQAIEILTENYSTAATGFEEILRLQRRLLNYQQAREEAIGNQNTAVARIEFLTGHYNMKEKTTE